MNYDVVLKNAKLVIPQFGTILANLAILDGRITAIAETSDHLNAHRVIDIDGLHVFPGLIDPHLHVEFAAGLAGWATESKAAAAGGVTTILNYLPPQSESYIGLLDQTRHVAEQDSVVDFGFHLICCSERHLQEVPDYVHRGVTSYKYFMNFRGSEGAHLGVPGTDDGFLYAYLRALRSENCVAAVHAENIEISQYLRKPLREMHREDLVAWDESRPAFLEAEAMYRSMFYSSEVGCPLYLVHASSRAAVDEVRAWRAQHPLDKTTLETCPHYLTHTREEPLGSLGKVNPPLRQNGDREALWQAIADGTVDTIGSDHCPRRKDAKEGSLWSVGGGFPGVQTILPVMLHFGYHERDISLERIVEVTSTEAAKKFGLFPQKGTIRVGSDADLVVVDITQRRRVSGPDLHGYADYSLYDGQELIGWPVMTLVRGEVVAESGDVNSDAQRGKFVHRLPRLSN